MLGWGGVDPRSPPISTSQNYVTKIQTALLSCDSETASCSGEYKKSDLQYRTAVVETVNHVLATNKSPVDKSSSSGNQHVSSSPSYITSNSLVLAFIFKTVPSYHERSPSTSN